MSKRETKIVGHISWNGLSEDERRVKPLPVRGSTTRSGYGRRIPTSRMVRLRGRWRRVYCCIYSNIGTCYVEQGKDWVVVTD
jgi:hypothetical protein